MRARGGYTLIELLTAMAVIAVLGGTLLPVLASAREQGRQATCLSNQRQIGLGCLLYAEDYDQALPTHAAEHRGRPSPWMAAVGAYVAPREVFRCPGDASDWGAVDPYYQVRRQSSYLFSFYLYDCGAEPGAPRGSCGYNTLPRIDMPASTVMLAEQRTGTAQVALVGDHFHAYAFKPNPPCRRELPEAHLATTRHHGGANYAFADGHARWQRIDQVLNWRWGRPEPARVVDRFDPQGGRRGSETTYSGPPPSCPDF